MLAAVAQWVRALAPQVEDLGFRIPATTDLNRKIESDSSTAKRSEIGVCVSRVLGDDLNKRMSRVTVGVAC